MRPATERYRIHQCAIRDNIDAHAFVGYDAIFTVSRNPKHRKPDINRDVQINIARYLGANQRSTYARHPFLARKDALDFSSLERSIEAEPDANFGFGLLGHSSLVHARWRPGVVLSVR
jgi:hypothetical protein